MPEHSFLCGDPARGGEPSESSIGSNYAVAGHDQRNRITGHGIAYRSGGVVSAGAFRQRGVGSRFSGGDLPARLQDHPLEWAATAQVNGRISTEIDVFALEVRGDAGLEIPSQARFELGVFGRRPQAAQEGFADRLGLWYG